jgi:hypothetical protein
MRDELSTQGSIQTPQFRTEKGCTGFPEQTQTFSRNQHRLLVQGMYSSEDARGLLPRSDRFTLRRSGRMEAAPHHGSSQPFYLHGLGLTLVTREAACFHQRAFLPPFGSHMSFQKNLG